jgi:hypothetical protein
MYPKFLFIIFLIIQFLKKNNLEIEYLFYINLKDEKIRNKVFIENYNKYGKHIKLKRIDGIISNNFSNNVTKGEKGCALSHMKVLKMISKKKNGWYLVCEDDCIGNYQQIEEKTRLVRNVLPFVGAINLYNNRKKTSGFGLNICLTSYLVRPWCAKIMYKIIKKNLDIQPCDCNLYDSIQLCFYTFHIPNVMKTNNLPSSIKKINKLKN